MKTDYKQYSICEVASWLIPESEVQLPVVQRGFVWKVSQIECLWDSIFRGYPIGAMMLSFDGDKYMLLDGQQRSTSVALGFYNPWEEEKNRIGNANNLPVVWIDIAPREKSDTQEYVFRVVTRSHPWGYQVKNNESILSYHSRKKASDIYNKLYGQSIYTKLLPNQRLPYDATCPIPLCFLLEAARFHDTKWLIDKCKELIPKEYHTSRMGDEESYHSLLDSIDISPLFDTVKTMVLPTMIPTIILPKDLLIDKNDNSPDDSTLFVRLNRQGTQIEGEELIYSMFKSVCPQTKDLVECLGMNIIAPSKVITLTSRLVLSENNYVANLNLAQFRKIVQDKGFVAKMEEMIGNEIYSPIKENINRAIDILKFGNVPNVVVKKYIRESPNGFLLLLHWLFKNDAEQIDEIKKQEIASRLYRNHWFGYDFDYYVRENWNMVSQPDFWCDKNFENKGIIRQYPLIKPKELLDFLEKRLENSVEEHSISPESADCATIWKQWEKSYPRSENISDEKYTNDISYAWNVFLYKLLGSRDKSLVLLAQRDYINQTFAEFNQLEDLEDTNTPWDWDHIYPNSWVYYQQQIDDRTKRWEWRIGNFRAMSLTDNRSENNNLSPAERFDEPNADYFICDNDLEYWKQLDANHKYIKEYHEEYVLIHAKAIITRSVNIYENFLKMFNIDY
ncbi:MAG: DUF262 domain-containing protein [Salinivirgaceae bacterium]|nr:DUF262 domain-containing protein [Salinivirgaceae bacterium]